MKKNIILSHKIIYIVLGVVFHSTFSSVTLYAQNWMVNNLLNFDVAGTNVQGNPQSVIDGDKKAVFFDGVDDGIFLDEMPLAGLEQFTIEVIFKPESGGNSEQRFFHSGEIRGDRVLLELRANENDWYFDAFIKAGEDSKALIEPTLTHPLNLWHRVAFVVNKGNLTTYINGKKELEAVINFTPIMSGQTSIGVRLNGQSWFKGAIEQIRISHKALTVEEFLELKY